MKIKGILIDSVNREVKNIEVEQGSLDDIYKALGCDCFDIVRLPNREGIYVDDEGLLKDKIEHAFTFDGKFLAGNGLILACDDEGESISTKFTVEYVRERVTFAPPGFVLDSAMQDKMTQMHVIPWD